MKEPDFDLVDNLVDEETSIDIESDAIESVNAGDEPVADDPVDYLVADPAVEEPALEPTVEDPLPIPGLPGVPAPAVPEPADDPDAVVIIDDMDYEETGDNMLEMVVEDMNLYEDGFNTHDKEDSPEYWGETAEKPDYGMHDKPMSHSDDDWHYPEDDYYEYASSTSTIALSIPAFIWAMFK